MYSGYIGIVMYTKGVIGGCTQCPTGSTYTNDEASSSPPPPPTSVPSSSPNSLGIIIPALAALVLIFFFFLVRKKCYRLYKGSNNPESYQRHVSLDNGEIDVVSSEIISPDKISIVSGEAIGFGKIIESEYKLKNTDMDINCV